MEHFYRSGEFYSDLSDYIESKGLSEQGINNLPEDFKLEVKCSYEERLITFTPSLILSMIDEERFSEAEQEYEAEKILKALEECVDFEKLNSKIPTMLYEGNDKHYFTKQDFLDAIAE